MGLRVIDLQIIERIRMSLPPHGRALALGYPDILMEAGEAKELFGLADDVPVRADTAEIAKWHGRKIDAIPETLALFAALGLDLDVWDIHASRGIERIVDLNEPYVGPHQTYDLVIEGGTIEHCFNIGQAMRTICDQVREGGFVFHDNPCNMYNHGFYNLNPTFYADWYEANGFVVTLLALTDGEKYLPVEGRTKFKNIPERMSMLAVARKTEHRMPAWPMQAKYVANPELKSA